MFSRICRRCRLLLSLLLLLYKYSTISHLIEIFGQLAPTIFRPRWCGCFSVNSFLNIGKMAVSPSSSSDSELAPYSSDLLRCERRCFSGATFGDEWWCECCDNLASLRCGVVGLIFSRSRSLSVSDWPSGNLGLWRCLVRVFSDTLRCIGVDVTLLESCMVCEWSWHRCWLLCRGCACRIFAADNVCVSQRSLCDTTKLPFNAAPTLTRLGCSWFRSENDESGHIRSPFYSGHFRRIFAEMKKMWLDAILLVLPLCGQMLFSSLFEWVNDCELVSCRFLDVFSSSSCITSKIKRSKFIDHKNTDKFAKKSHHIQVVLTL